VLGEKMARRGSFSIYVIGYAFKELVEGAIGTYT
jgi:hypothetical protein